MNSTIHLRSPPHPSAILYANDAMLTATIKVMMITRGIGVVTITDPVM